MPNCLDVSLCNGMTHKEVYEWKMQEQFISAMNGKLKLIGCHLDQTYLNDQINLIA